MIYTIAWKGFVDIESIVGGVSQYDSPDIGINSEGLDSFCCQAPRKRYILLVVSGDKIYQNCERLLT